MGNGEKWGRIISRIFPQFFTSLHIPPVLLMSSPPISPFFPPFPIFPRERCRVPDCRPCRGCLDLASSSAFVIVCTGRTGYKWPFSRITDPGFGAPP